MRARHRPRTDRCPRRARRRRRGSRRRSRSRRHGVRAATGAGGSAASGSARARRARSRRLSHAPLGRGGSRPTASAVGGRPASMQSSSLQASTDAAIGVLVRRPRRAQLELRAVALAGEFAESGRQHLGRGARCGAVVRRRAGERVFEPRPRDAGDERVEADVGLEGCLGEADDPERARPRRRGPRGRGAARSGRCPGASRRRGAPGARLRPSRWRTGRARSAPGSRSARVRGGSSTRARRPGPGRRGPGRPGLTQFRTRVQTRVSSGASSRATPTPRRSTGAQRMGRRVVGGIAIGVAAAAGAAALAAATLSILVARTVIIPPSRRTEDVTILGLDLAAGTIVLSLQRRLPAARASTASGSPATPGMPGSARSSRATTTP